VTTQQIHSPALARSTAALVCRSCQQPSPRLSTRVKRCPACAERTSLEREATFLIVAGSSAIALGISLVAYLAAQVA
jgi:Zn finger protein HypA/HybF involved in hydrogenase expression